MDWVAEYFHTIVLLDASGVPQSLRGWDHFG